MLDLAAPETSPWVTLSQGEPSASAPPERSFSRCPHARLRPHVRICRAGGAPRPGAGSFCGRREFRGFGRFGGNRGRSGRFGFDRYRSNRSRFNQFGLQPVRLERQCLGLPACSVSVAGAIGATLGATRKRRAPAAPIVVDGGCVRRWRSTSLPAVAAGAGDPPAGGCVIHMLRYDAAGRYVGERQFLGC